MIGWVRLRLVFSELRCNAHKSEPLARSSVRRRCTQFPERPHTLRKSHWWPYFDDRNANIASMDPESGEALPLRIISLFADQFYAALQRGRTAGRRATLIAMLNHTR